MLKIFQAPILVILHHVRIKEFAMQSMVVNSGANVHQD